MQKFQIHTGVAVPLMQDNIDTDAIIPSREMKRVSKTGLGEGLFAGWRYTLPGGRELNSDFILNKSEYANSTIILAGENFGCGSSREHAVWALKEYGIRAIIALGFGSIFYNNCIRNGILPLVLQREQIESLSEFVKAQPQKNQLKIDLQKKRVESSSILSYTFNIKSAQQQMLLEGMDSIALTQTLSEEISRFSQSYEKRFPWLV
jgi:3-isopropylmalate/(R)-2-methylmalate dehydratase small subunit